MGGASVEPQDAEASGIQGYARVDVAGRVGEGGLGSEGDGEGIEGEFGEGGEIECVRFGRNAEMRNMRSSVSATTQPSRPGPIFCTFLLMTLPTTRSETTNGEFLLLIMAMVFAAPILTSTG